MLLITCHFILFLLFHRGIEVRALEQKIRIQSMKMTELKDQIKIIVHGEMTLVASHSLVYQITAQHISCYIN